MSDVLPPLQAAPQPVPLTSFIGRDWEIATAVALLDRLDVRLLTLTGPGGVGKTRLALRIVESVKGSEVAVVSLAQVRDRDLVLSTIARALNVPEAVDQSPFESLQGFLASRQMLLVLDNLEHLLDTAAPRIWRRVRASASTPAATSPRRSRWTGKRSRPQDSRAISRRWTGWTATRQ